MDLHPWMLLVPSALSAGAVPLARRHPVAAWVAWAVLAVVTLAGVVLFAAGVALLQTVLGAIVELYRRDPDGGRGHVDLWFLAPWAAASGAVLVATGIGVARSRRTAPRP